jgi:hypothetical protein
MQNFRHHDFVEAYLQELVLKRPDLEHTSNIMSVVQSLFKDLPCEERQEIHRMQAFLIDKFSDYQPEPIKLSFDPLNSTWQSVHKLLDCGQKRRAELLVAIHLVKATLELRFPALHIASECFSGADLQWGRPGDFRVGDTVFHVTVAPSHAVYEKCKRNLDKGLKVYLLVPERLSTGTKQNAELQATGKVSVQSIESFVSQNIDEVAQFSKSALRKEFRRLLELYNKRVNATETNKSMMIEIPSNL